MFDMSKYINVKNIFKPNRKCIINTDLDGLLSGMILQHFLNWEIVGFSCCNGKTTDDLWLKDPKIDLKDCVFVDLPVCMKEYTVIDQHFVAFEEDCVKEYIENNNKINPNIIRKKVFKDKAGKNHYTEKYPFGTVHFVIAVLENIGIINDNFSFNFTKKIDNFELADLILRADRVIGNTNSYRLNCFKWANWIINIGKENTCNLFSIVKKEYDKRKNKEYLVEGKLKSLGCIGTDGDCSNMFRNKDYEKIKEYFTFLADSLDMKQIPIFKVYDFNLLSGKRLAVNSGLKERVINSNIFSFAFVNMRTLSVTYLKDK